MRVIGYTYEADMHCVSCTSDRFNGRQDRPETEDSEGNPIHPIFSTDEYDDVMICGDCDEELE